MKMYLIRPLRGTDGDSERQLLAGRYEKIRRMGMFYEDGQLQGAGAAAAKDRNGAEAHGLHPCDDGAACFMRPSIAGWHGQETGP